MIIFMPMPAWRHPSQLAHPFRRPAISAVAKALLLGFLLLPTSGWGAAYAFPSTILDRIGFEDLSGPNDTCCQTRLVGWNAEGQIATATSEYLPDQGVFRFGVDFHDLVNDQPRELFGRKYFRADPEITGACAKSKDLLRCLWKENQTQISQELRNAGITQGIGRKLLPLPRHSIEWSMDPDRTGESAPFSISDSAEKLVFHMVDTAAGGLHLVPFGMIGDKSAKRRWLVLRLSRRELLDAPMTVLGIRFLRLDSTP